MKANIIHDQMPTTHATVLFDLPQFKQCRAAGNSKHQDLSLDRDFQKQVINSQWDRTSKFGPKRAFFGHFTPHKSS